MIADPVTIPTSQGPAAVRVHPPTRGSQGSILLGHGAGGALGSWPQDLQSVLSATAHGWTVVLVEQPWRVAGRRIATRPPTLDQAWAELVPALPKAALSPPLVYGGRSAGARVACRTSPGQPPAGLPRADAVLCLAFPLHPPGKPERSRVEELATPVRLGIPTLVVQGTTDPFGTPGEVEQALAAAVHPPPTDDVLELVAAPGTHSPSRDQQLVTGAVLRWLEQLG